MCSSFKKTQWFIFVFLFVLVLTVTLVAYFNLTSVFQREVKLIVTAPIVVEKAENIKPNSDNSSVIICEYPNTQDIPSEDIDIGCNNVIVPSETRMSETGTPIPNEAVDDTVANDGVVQERSVGERSSLFIGDSRTMGLANFTSVENANYFAATGMTVYNLFEKRVSVPKIGKVTLEELLNHKKYDIIYVMLGINELGYAFEKTVERYKMLIEYVKQVQPEATVVLMANIHVTSERSETDKYINNPAIDRFNDATAKMADNKTTFYLDANILFDDENGNLAKEKSSDSAHLKSKYCVQWAEWLEDETTKLILYAEGQKGDG